MKYVQVKVPGSCGELIQGFYGDGEALVSYAIDCYSTVSIEPSDQYALSMNHHNEKAMIALRRACEYFGIDHNHLKVRIESDIPVGKGMASSTADIVGVLAAVSILAKRPIDPRWIGKMAASIEPTDSIMFPDWMLFDHLHGEVIEKFESFDDLKVIVLEMNDVVNTKSLRESGAFMKSSKPNPSNALSIFREATAKRDLELLGQAINLSSSENQVVLKKPFLSELTALASEFGMIGINTSHSGTVLGVIYNDDGKPEEFLTEAQLRGYLEPYPRKTYHRIIRGGTRVDIK